MGELAAILTGGLGTRLKAAVPDLPKPLAPVRGRPFLSYLLGWLGSEGVEDAVLLLGHGGPAMQDFLAGWNAAGWPPRLAASVETEPLGTGGAVRLALGLLPEEFYLLNGDSLCPLPLEELAGSHRQGGRELTIAAVHEPEGAARGALDIGPDARVRGFAEKSRAGPGWINAGVYRARRGLFEELPEGRAVSLERELIPEWIARGVSVGAYRARAPFLDIGTPADWERAQQEGWLQ